MSQTRFEGIEFSEFEIKEKNPDLAELGQGSFLLKLWWKSSKHSGGIA